MKAAVLVLVVAAGLITQVGTANTAVFYLRSLQLEQSWRSAEEAARTQSARDQLAADSGGLSEGLPKDVVEGLAALKALAESASRSGISSDPAWQTGVDVQLYLARPYPALLQGHAVVAQELKGALSVVGKRVNARKTAESDLEQIPKLLPRALRYGIGDEYSSQADELKKSFALARGDDDLVKV